MARKRENRVTVCLDDKELEKYEKLLKKSKLSKQDYGLKCLLNKDIIVVDGIVDLALQIRKIGVNINQVVHLANEVHNVSDNQVQELDDKVAEVWKLLNDFVRSVKSKG